MPYIARTDGGLAVLEMRQGVLTDLAEADRPNWRTVSETRQTHDPLRQVLSAPVLSVSEDGAQVTLITYAADIPPQMVKMRLKDYAAGRRWARQQMPLSLPDGTIIDASEGSKNKIDLALRGIEKGWATTIRWKGENGRITVDAAALNAIGQALYTREQALFDVEEDIDDAIDAGTVTTIAQIDGWSWP